MLIDNIQLKDAFEWDINDPTNNPEEFAKILCEEVGLNREFYVQIVHSIRSQITSFKKELSDFGIKSIIPQEDAQPTSIGNAVKIKKSTKSLLENSEGFIGKFGGREVSKSWLREVQEVYIDGADNIDGWGPVIEILDAENLEKQRKLEERKNRYEKRRR